MNAPVVIFAYNRLGHLENLIASLLKNPEFIKSDVFIFVDGPKSSNDSKVELVRDYTKELKASGKIPKLTLIIRDENIGLAESIITGVTEVIRKYKKVIVVEDDTVTTPDFLDYMNGALAYYENNKTIWSIGGYTFLENIKSRYGKDVFKTQRCSSYAWGTWLDRWEKIDWEVLDYSEFKWNIVKRKSFNRWGNDKSIMLDKQMTKKINSWAIRFDYNMWKNGMYNILPARSRLNNMGQDGSGTHSCKPSSASPFWIDIDDDYVETIFENIEINANIQLEYEKVFNIGLIRRIYNFFKVNILCK